MAEMRKFSQGDFPGAVPSKPVPVADLGEKSPSPAGTPVAFLPVQEVVPMHREGEAGQADVIRLLSDPAGEHAVVAIGPADQPFGRQRIHVLAHVEADHSLG